MSQSGKVSDTGGAGGASTFNTDSGAAVEAGGIINILGTAPISTSGAGNTVTIADDGTIPTSFPTDSGSATPAANSLSILGTGSTSTSGAGSTVTINSQNQLELIATAVASTSATIEFTGLSSTYYLYMIVITGINSDTAAVDLEMRTSSDNGTSFDAGATDYGWTSMGSSATPGGVVTTLDTGDSTADSIIISGTDISLEFDADTNEEKYFNILLYNPSNSFFTHITSQGSGRDDSSDFMQFYTGVGMRKEAGLVDAIQFLMSAGNIDIGTFKLYGIRA